MLIWKMGVEKKVSNSCKVEFSKTLILRKAELKVFSLQQFLGEGSLLTVCKGAPVGVGHCKGQSRKDSNLELSVDFATDGPQSVIETNPHNALHSPLPNSFPSSALRGTMSALRCFLLWVGSGSGVGGGKVDPASTKIDQNRPKLTQIWPAFLWLKIRFPSTFCG